jgi:hypothetical protein
MEDRNPTFINETARADFHAALRRGFWHSVIGWITQAAARCCRMMKFAKVYH